MLNRQEPAHLCGQTPRLESAICKDWEALVKARLRRRQQAAVNGEKLEDLVGVTFALNFDDRGDALCPKSTCCPPSSICMSALQTSRGPSKMTECKWRPPFGYEAFGREAEALFRERACSKALSHCLSRSNQEPKTFSNSTAEYACRIL